MIKYHNIEYKNYFICDHQNKGVDQEDFKYFHIILT